MRKGIGHYTACSLFLQAVIANGIGGIQCFFNITRFNNAFCLCIVRPNTCQKIGLQFQLYR